MFIKTKKERVDTTAYRVHAEIRFPVDDWEDTACKLLLLAAKEIDRLNEKRLDQDRTIHNQRVALRQNWEITEARAQWTRAWYPSKLLKSLLNRATKTV